MTPRENFAAIAPKYMAMCMKDFDFSRDDVNAIFGNAGYESAGFTKLQEIKPVVKGSRGGYGWFQWTGPRRVAYESYCKRNKLDPASPESNYKFLFVELSGPEKKAVKALKDKTTLNDKVIAFEETYERAGIKAYKLRQEWAAFAATLDVPLEVVKADVATTSNGNFWINILMAIFRMFIK